MVLQLRGPISTYQYNRSLWFHKQVCSISWAAYAKCPCQKTLSLVSSIWCSICFKPVALELVWTWSERKVPSPEWKDPSCPHCNYSYYTHRLTFYRTHKYILVYLVGNYNSVKHQILSIEVLLFSSMKMTSCDVLGKELGNLWYSAHIF
jgi:hypothetical protein